MRELQTVYLTASNRDFATSFKNRSIEEQEELIMIHKIQLLSNSLRRKFDKYDYQEFERLKSDYIEKYGPYEIEHYSMQTANTFKH